MVRRIATRRYLIVAGAIWGTLTGCSSAVHLHDAANAQASKDASDKFAAAEVGKVIDVEQANLASLLEEELKVVRANRQLRFDLELLRLAADETTPMARSLEEATTRIKALGFADVKAARAFLIQDVAVTFYKEFMADSQARARLAGGPSFPSCPQNGGPPDLKLDASLTPLQKAAISSEYDAYKKRCAELQRSSEPLLGDLYGKRLEITEAQRQVLALRAAIKEGGASAAAIAEEKAAAEKAGTAPAIAATVRAQAENVNQKLGRGIKALGSLGLDHPAFARIDDIQTVLRAVADGSLEDAQTPDSELQKAADAARQIPGLAQDMADLIATAKAPSVANLLIALNHQKILIAGDEARLLLAQQRVDLLSAQYDALVDELRAARDLHDGLCTYATLSAGGSRPGEACDSFAVKVGRDQSGRITAVTCTGADGAPIADCALARPWRDALAASGQSIPAKRALYEAIRAIAFGHDATTRSIELDYRLIDLDHREAVAANRLALEAWNNLVAVPVEQIAGYHAAGIKPDEIAQLIVQALGFTAVTTAIVVK
jgi:hypothetical protein